MAILVPLGVDQTSGQSRTLKSGDTLDSSGISFDFLNIGSAAAAVATGDLAAGDGTNSLFYDASLSVFSLDGDLPGGDVEHLVKNSSSVGGSTAANSYIYNDMDEGVIITVTGSGATLPNLAFVRSSATSSFVIGTIPSASVVFRSADTDRWIITDAGHFVGGTDNTYDIGASGATRPRTGYFGTALNVGNGITASTANGDIVAGDGTTSMFYDADVGRLLIDNGTVINGVPLDIDMNFNGIAQVDITNTNAGSSARAGYEANSDSSQISVSAFSAVNQSGRTQLSSTGGEMWIGTLDTNDLVFRTGGSASALQRWRIDGSNALTDGTSGHFLTHIDNTYDIGASGATRPRTGYFGTALNVGNGITPSTANGDIVAGDGTRSLTWDASEGDMLINAGASVGMVYDSGLNRIRIGSSSASSGITQGGTNLGGNLIVGASNGSIGTTSALAEGAILAAGGVGTGTGGSALYWTGDNVGQLRLLLRDDNTATAGDRIQLYHTVSNGTAAAGMGNRIGSYAMSTTGANRLQGVIRWEWSVATDASFTSDVDFTLASSAVSTLAMSLRGSDVATVLTGNLRFSTDNTQDIGATASERPRTGYFGTELVVDGAALPRILSRTASIDLTATGDTAIYTVPTGQSAIITRIVVQITAATGAAGDASISVGTNAATYDDIAATTILTGLDATTKSFAIETSGNTHTGASTEVIRFQVDTADSTATTLTATVHLIGFLF